MMAYGGSVHETTGETPNILMFGRKIQLLTDAVVKKSPDASDKPNDMEYEVLLSRIRDAQDRARGNLKKQLRDQKENYGRKAYGKGFKVRDQVWLHNPIRKKDISPKLIYPWEGPFITIFKLSDVTFNTEKTECKAKTCSL